MEITQLREYFSEGTVIRTKHGNNMSWVTNVVYLINEDCIEIDIGLEKDYIDNIIMLGDTMKCKYASDECEITLTGLVLRIKADFPQSITIKVMDIQKFENKRDSYRFDVYFCSVLKLANGDDKQVFSVMTNISRTGAAFVVNEELEKELGYKNISKVEKVLVFEVYISPEKKMDFKGVIKRKSNVERGIEYGVKITDIDEKNEKILSELLEELEKIDKEFYNKRSSFWSKHSKYNNGGDKTSK